MTIQYLSDNQIRTNQFVKLPIFERSLLISSDLRLDRSYTSRKYKPDKQPIWYLSDHLDQNVQTTLKLKNRIYDPSLEKRNGTLKMPFNAHLMDQSLEIRGLVGFPKDYPKFLADDSRLNAVNARKGAFFQNYKQL